MKRAQFVAIGITQISQIHLTTWANAGRVFDCRAAVGHTGFVPGRGLFGSCHREAYRASIGVSGRLAIDRLAHQQ